MSKIAFESNFGGIMPRVDPKLLPDTAAQVAENLRLISGKIVPLNGMTDVKALSGGAQVIYLWKHGEGSQEWLTWNTDTDVVRGPVADDEKFRIYYTDPGMGGLSDSPNMYVKAFFKFYNDTYPTSTDDPTTWPPNGTLDGFGIVTPAGSGDGYVITRKAKLAVGGDTLSIHAVDRVDFSGKSTIAGIGVAHMDISTIASDGSVTNKSKDISAILASTGMIISTEMDKYTGAWTLRGYLPTGLSSSIGYLGKTSIQDAYVDSFGITCRIPGYLNQDDKPDLNDGDKITLSDEFGQFGTAHIFISFTPPTLKLNSGWTVVREEVVVTITIAPTFTQGPSSLQYVSYVQTVVDDWLTEGPPSDPTSVIEWSPGQKLQITGIGGNVPTGGHARIYRTAAGTNEDHFYYLPYESITGIELSDNPIFSEVDVEGFPQGVTYYVDILSDSDLAEELPVFENPPDDLRGLVALPNGTLAGFHAGDPTATNQPRELCFSSVGYPQSWPTEYRETTEYDIVGLGVTGNDLAVLTTGYHDMATGSDPSQISMSRIVTPYACISKNSITTINGMVCFACPQGIAAIAGADCRLLTDKYYSGKEWQPLSPINMRMRAHDTGLVGFFVAGNTGILFDMDSNDSAQIAVTTTNLSDLNDNVTAMFLDIESDVLYLAVRNGSDVSIKSWNTDAAHPLLATWKSKNFVSNRLTNWTSARIVASGYITNPLMDFFPDGAAVSVQRVAFASQVSRRIPKMRPQRCWAIQVKTLSQIDSLLLGTSMQEIIP